MSERWYWLDWLRVLAMGTIFLFHSSRPFVIFPSWHIMNPTPDLGFTLFDTFISGWIMPLFFVISGIAVYSSLARRSASQFARDRLERLIIPFVFGLFFVLPVNVYYDVVFHGYFVGDFVSFYLGPYFTRAFPFSVNFSPTYFADSNQGVYLWYSSGCSYSPSSQSNSSSGSRKKETATSSRNYMPHVTGAEASSCLRFL